MDSNKPLDVLEYDLLLISHHCFIYLTVLAYSLLNDQKLKWELM